MPNKHTANLFSKDPLVKLPLSSVQILVETTCIKMSDIKQQTVV